MLKQENVNIKHLKLDYSYCIQQKFNRQTLQYEKIAMLSLNNAWHKGK